MSKLCPLPRYDEQGQTGRPKKELQTMTIGELNAEILSVQAFLKKLKGQLDKKVKESEEETIQEAKPPEDLSVQVFFYLCLMCSGLGFFFQDVW